MATYAREQGVCDRALTRRRRLFERFFTTHRDQGGTGLGLAIVKAIAEARGGRVELVDAAAGPQGATFVVVL